MTRALYRCLRFTLVASLGAGSLLLSDNATLTQSGSLLSEAHSRL
jgi:hypothetical protein